MKIYIDNQLVIFPNDSLLEPKFSFRRKNQDGERSVSFTGDLTFTGVDYNYIYNKLVLDPQAINNSVVLKFVDDCCGNTEYIFLIKPESLKWCENSCELTANAVEYTPEARAYTCIESTLIFDDYAGFQSAQHPRMKYCLEYRPSILQDFALVLGTATLSMIGVLIPVLATIGSIIYVINLIITAINNLGASINTIGGFSSNLLGPGSFMDFIFNTYNSFGQVVAGCGYEHPSPLVRSYIRNVCNKCHLSFSSSILDESNTSKANYDYYNMVYFSAPVKHGRISIQYFAKPLVPYITDNRPIHNLKTFLDEIKQVFNAEWDISGTTVRFERRDFFLSTAPWFDVTTYNKEKVISECYEWSANRRPAYGDFQWQADAIDWCGSEAKGRMSDIVDWNSPPLPTQKGALTKIMPYSPARFRNDGIERDVLSDYNWLPFGIGISIIANDNAMIMNSGTSWTPKLLLWDGVYKEINNATVKWQYPVTTGATRSYNFPLWFAPSYPSGLYQRFWAIENPRNSSFSGFDFEIQVVWDCNLLNALNLNDPIMTTRGLSKTITVIDLDFSNSLMTIKGTI